MSKRNEFLTVGVSEKRAKARRQAKAGTPMGGYLELLRGFAKGNHKRIHGGIHDDSCVAESRNLPVFS
jgi:hypothetical protein